MRIDLSDGELIGTDGNILLEGTITLGISAPGRTGEFDSKFTYRRDGVGTSWEGSGPFPESPQVYLTNSHLAIAEGRRRDEDGNDVRDFVGWNYYRITDLVPTFFPPSLLSLRLKAYRDGIVSLVGDSGHLILQYSEDFAVYADGSDIYEIDGELDTLNWSSTGVSPGFMFPSCTDIRTVSGETFVVIGGSFGNLRVFHSSESSPKLTKTYANLLISIPLFDSGIYIRNIAVLPDGRIFFTCTSGVADDYVGWAISEDPVTTASAPTSWVANKIEGLPDSNLPIAVDPAGNYYVAVSNSILEVDTTTAEIISAKQGQFSPIEETGISQDFPPVGPFSNLKWDGPFPVVLQDVEDRFGGGTMLSICSPDLSKVTYRRWYRSTVFTLETTPSQVPGSVPVYPGYTPDPSPGVGPGGDR